MTSSVPTPGDLGGAVGPAFDPHDLEVALGAGTIAVVVKGVGSDAHVATRDAIEAFRRIQEAEPSLVAGVVGLLEARPGKPLLSSVQMMTSLLGESFGVDVHLVTRGTVSATCRAGDPPGTSVYLTVAVVPSLPP